MTQWEYKGIEFLHLNKNIIEIFDKVGEDKWELICIINQFDDIKKVAIFKRLKTVFVRQNEE